MQTETTISWEAPPKSLQLAPHEIHVWCADLATQSFPLATCAALLSEEERARAARFRFPKDQQQFTITRALLRLLLGRYLHLSPAALRFGYGAQGKPWLLEAHNTPQSLRFNLAHSGDLILYAVRQERELGIDVEFIRAETSYETIAEQFFAPAEVAALRALPLAEQPQAFFNIWTRKEAFIKARGDGLSFPLDGFAVSLDAQLPVALEVYQFPRESKRWKLYHLVPKAQYVGALAAEGEPHILRCYSTRGLTALIP